MEPLFLQCFQESLELKPLLPHHPDQIGLHRIDRWWWVVQEHDHEKGQVLLLLRLR